MNYLMHIFKGILKPCLYIDLPSCFFMHKRHLLSLVLTALSVSVLSTPVQSASKSMTDSPLMFHSHNVDALSKWKGVDSYPGYVNSEAILENTWRVYSVKNVPVKNAKDLVVLEDKYGQLSNPINSIARLHKASKGEGFDNITTMVASIGATPAHFIATSPGKITQPNAIFYFGQGAKIDSFFVTYEAIDANIMLNGSLHCAYSTKKGAFDYLQLNVGNIDRSTLGLFMGEICANLKNLLK